MTKNVYQNQKAWIEKEKRGDNKNEKCVKIVTNRNGQKPSDTKPFLNWLQLKLVDDMLDVDLFIIVEYGISIAEVCKTIVETVRYKLESMTGVKVRRVNISVEGVRV